MGHTGTNPKENVIAVIPARYGSTRLPGKLLLPINGKPVIVWTIEQALKARCVSRVIVATDSPEIQRIAMTVRCETRMTRGDHASGSDRVAEVARELDAEIIVNIQADEPLIDPRTIDLAVSALQSDEQAQMATTWEPIESAADVLNPAVVKITIDEQGRAMQFSRTPIPYPDEAVKKHGTVEAALENEPALVSLFRKHTGLYVYRREFLIEFTSWPQTESERRESLEQLRALEHGVKIRVVQAARSSIGIDTAEDLERARKAVGAARHLTTS